jgi:hypothetical protein
VIENGLLADQLADHQQLPVDMPSGGQKAAITSDQRVNACQIPLEVTKLLLDRFADLADPWLLSSDIRFWSSGDTKTGPPDGLLTGALRRPLDWCFIGGCRVVVVGGGICAA